MTHERDGHRSMTDSVWKELPADPEVVLDLVERHRLSSVAARVVANRIASDPAYEWRRPTLDDLLDPALMFGMDRAVARVRQAVSRGERVRLITDYDVDGTTSSLILQATFKIAGARSSGPQLQVDYHIPDRFEDGYGFSVKAAETAVRDGVDLIVTADIGVRDHAAVNAARAGGVDVLICDHHLPSGAAVPDNAIVLCPPQAACDYPNRHLAACGVSMKLAQAVLADHPKYPAILDSLLKLAAIGTVADLVPLTTAENRAIVSLGLDRLNRGPHHPGLAALLAVSKNGDGAIGETDLGFGVGPRINAAGRVAHARMVVDLLTCRDPIQARKMARALDDLNTERKNIQRRLTTAALALVTDEPDPFVVVAGPEEEGWHRGVVGIVASKIKEKVFRPAAVLSIQGDFAVASVRSIPGVHAVEALDSVSDLLVKYGGHPAAAGFTVPTDKIHELRRRLGEFVSATTTADQLVSVENTANSKRNAKPRSPH